MTTREPLLPCPFCGAKMAMRGDYTHEHAWNFYTHEDREERDNCILSQYEIPCGPDFTTPSKSLADAWNARALTPPEPTDTNRAETILREFEELHGQITIDERKWLRDRIATEISPPEPTGSRNAQLLGIAERLDGCFEPTTPLTPILSELVPAVRDAITQLRVLAQLRAMPLQDGAATQDKRGAP